MVKETTTMTVKEMFDAADGEYLKFDRIESPKHGRPDICAFLMLHRIFPGTTDMVSGARHDGICLAPSLYDAAEVAGLTPEIVVDLCRCGVLYNEEYDCFEMLT